MTLSDDLDGIFLDIGPHRIRLIDAINDWADRVLKLLFDSREQSLKSTGSVWSLYDLIASLIRRDAIERTINSHSVQTHESRSSRQSMSFSSLSHVKLSSTSRHYPMKTRSLTTRTGGG